ncbi:condensation domain-containing protein [Streptomyces johnsoniae]|uniref:Condensation domain-containing protein n=1 Tax=Streptomyces johnsoniae TaxID=3075532 RepID=A0ABU2S8W8_9ACTN|nr:condensation domain-containing protein [Streptomyces sp. DSM 41886]MDT0445421.1 condensation domain-containing protein [Streptomyces sp. DSM 41886]
MNAEDAQESMEVVLIEALIRRDGGDPASISTARSWAQNGGSSLDAYAAIMRIEEELGLVVPVARLLGPSPLSEFIRQATAAPASAPPETTAAAGAVAATASQRRHWRHAQGEGSAAFLHIGRALRCTRGFDADRAEAAFRALVARHESLRNRYVSTPDGLFLDEVADWPERAAFVRHPEAPDAEAATAPIREEVGRAFPLATEPPVRGGCVPLVDGTAVVYFVVHHITADGWTVDLLADDFLALYTKAGDPELDELDELDKLGELDELGELAPAAPFSRYAAALDTTARAGAYADDIAYWQKKFARVSPDFTIARRHGAASGQRAGTSRLVWDGPGEANAVRDRARELGVTTYSLLLSGLLAAAHVLSGKDDVVVMSGVANRNRAEYRHTAGLFTNQIFFVGDFRATGTTDSYVRQVHDDVIESLARSQLPIEVVLDEMGAYDMARTLAPYANILFQAAEAPIAPPPIRDGTWQPHPLGTGSIKRHCNIHLEDDGAEGLALELDYSLALVGEHDAARLLRALRAAADHIVQGGDGSVSELLAVVREAAGDPAPTLTIFSVDYPGARAEPSLAAIVRDSLPGAKIVELPVPLSLDAEEIEECLRRGHALMGRDSSGPAAVLGYCSAAAWARHLVATLPGPDAAPALLSVNDNALTETDWYEEFTDLIGRLTPGADLAEVAPARIALPRDGDLSSRCAAARDALAVMRRILEGALEERFGTPLGRVARETLAVQLKWLSYLGSCVVVGAEPGPVDERGLPGVRLDQGPRIFAWIRAELDPEGTLS